MSMNRWFELLIWLTLSIPLLFIGSFAFLLTLSTCCNGLTLWQSSGLGVFTRLYVLAWIVLPGGGGMAILVYGLRRALR